MSKQIPQHTLPEASTERRYHVTSAQLPVCCPPQADRVWDSHPRVYLPIEATGQAVCPYCNAEYILTDMPLTHTSS
jgi:uncharacterized Zn-finger protein